MNGEIAAILAVDGVASGAIYVLIGHDHRAGRNLHAFDGLAAHPDEVRVEQRRCAVEWALVAAFG